jgi:hypothetical protein
MFIGTGANPTNVCDHSSVVEINNATSSLVRFQNKNIFIYFEKNIYLAVHTYYNAGVEVVNSKVVGLAPELVSNVPTLEKIRKKITFSVCNESVTGYIFSLLCTGKIATGFIW